ALEQLQVVELCLEGEALSWYCWSEGRSPFRLWEGLKRQLFNRFQQTQQELADKRSKGLCFKCDQKFGPGHICASRPLQVLLVDEEEEYKEKDGEELKIATDHAHFDMVEVSLNSVMGFTLNHTMKLRGKIGEREVAVLIDCGATHNFISSKI
nr:putative mitochondrial protein [Tanacetum cinerariifolium]